MSAEAKIKQEARARLSNNNWAKAVAVTVLVLSVSLIYSLCTECAAYILHSSNTPFLFNKDVFSQLPEFLANQLQNQNMRIFILAAALIAVLYVLVAVPLHLGSSRWYYGIALGDSPSVAEVFYYFSGAGLYFRSLRYAVAITARLILWFFLCFSPCLVLFDILGEVLKKHPDIATASWYVPLSFFSLFLLAACAVLFIAAALGYFTAAYAVVVFEEQSVTACIKTARQSMRHHRISVLLLLLSFVPWLLLCFFVLPVLFVLPYGSASLATCAKWILWDKKKTA